MRTIDECLIQLQISRPPADPAQDRGFIENLLKERSWLRGEDDAQPELDREGLQKFKRQLSQNSKFIAVK